MSAPPRRQASKHWETPTRTQVLALLEEGYIINVKFLAEPVFHKYYCKMEQKSQPYAT
jgi:ribulose bisphosphate carboxylase small subunit